MALTDVVSTASVRAVLGVSERELRDAVLLDPVYSIRLTLALKTLHAELLADFVEIAALPTKTDAQQLFVDLLQAYSAYLVAQLCMAAVPMFAPETIKDSRSEMTRGASPYAKLAGDIAASLNLLKTNLLAAYLVINPDATFTATTARILAVAAPLAVDPVTG